MVDFRDHEDVKAWLRSLPLPLSLAFTTRAALRSAPGIGLDTVDAQSRSVLPIFRAILTSGVAAVRPSAAIKSAAGASFHATQVAIDDVGSFVTRAPEAAAATVLGAKNSVANAGSVSSALSAAQDAAYASSNAQPRGWRAEKEEEFMLLAIAAEATSLRSASSAANLFGRPLWDEVGIPPGVEAGLAKLRAFFQTDHAAWRFWQRWYDGMSNGDPLPWDVQEEVALIPNAFWQAGPNAVAERIAEIEARFEVARRVEDLEKKLARGVSQRLGIGGNDPPEAIDDLPSHVREETLLLWEPILELKEQTQAEVAEPAKIRSALSKLVGMLAACGKWVGGKLDAAATVFAQQIGEWGAKGMIALIAAHHLEIQSLIRAVGSWLSKLPPP